MARVPGDFHMQPGYERLSQGAPAMRPTPISNLHVDCVSPGPLGGRVESLIRQFHRCPGLVGCQQGRCPVPGATKGEQTGPNPITFLVETNIWTDSFFFFPHHIMAPSTRPFILILKAIKNHFFPSVICSRKSDVMGSLSL